MAAYYLRNMDLMKYAKWIYLIPWIFRKVFRKNSTFTHDGRKHNYFAHPYNATWLNERAVEIPVIVEQIRKYNSISVLEIGNVTSHYFKTSHIVIDKYESSSMAVPVDIMDYNPGRQFDCIVSISTIEHVGWDEVPRDKQKHRRAIERILTWLAPGGKLFVTIPLGYNPSIDADIFSGALNCPTIHYFKRIGTTEWINADKTEVLGSSYGSEYRSTNGLAICEWTSK